MLGLLMGAVDLGVLAGAVAAEAGGGLVEDLASRVTRRLVTGATAGAIDALPDVGVALFQGVTKLVKQNAKPTTTPSPDEPVGLQKIIVGEMEHMGVTLVSTAELKALRAIATAAKGDGDMAEALETLKQARPPQV
jgi:hypothetical protein